MTASPKRHRHRVEPQPRRAPSWSRPLTVAPIVSIGVIAVAVLTSASASPTPLGASVGAHEEVAPTTLQAPYSRRGERTGGRDLDAPDADVPWLGPAIDA